ncbi:Trimeric GatFAB AmidoTransferase(AdT) complex subunit [Mortierella sp. AM989]|nr:Trimeric GatFAB AmidoTransferase(AdT) complex subunit [Mortierella sp. AM989]
MLSASTLLRQSILRQRFPARQFTTSLAGKSLAKSIFNESYTPVSAATEALESISKYNKYVNAFVDVTDPEAIRDQVKESASRWENGQSKSPLDGAIFGYKMNFCTKELRTTCASDMLYNFKAPYTATAIELLQNAGAITGGKLNMDEFGMGSHNVFSNVGPVKNPHGILNRAPESFDDVESRSAGGSSGGSAAAVASKMCFAALGSDTGGSVRLPASYCGVVGFKPSYGRISRWGLVAYSSSLDTVGTLTRTVDDAKTIFDIISKEDEKDSTCLTQRQRDVIAKALKDFTGREAELLGSDKQTDSRPLSGVRIGIPQEFNIAELSPATKELWKRGIQTLKDAGAKVVPVLLPTTPLTVGAYLTLATAEASSNLQRYDGIRYGQFVKSYIFFGRVYKNVLSRIRQMIRNDFDRVFAQPNGITGSFAPVADRIQDDRVHALLTPVAVETAPKLVDVIGDYIDPINAYLDDILTIPASLAGLPAMSVPFGKGKDDGFPVGLQVISQYGDEETVFKELMSSHKKYFHQLHPQPLDLPEIICRIRSHLSVTDIKKCMLVCVIWARHFGPFLWEVIYYIRYSQKDSTFGKNGHLIQKLVTYSLRDNDLKAIAMCCPNLSALDLEIGTLENTSVLFELFTRANKLQKLRLQLLYPDKLFGIQCTILNLIAQGILSQLTELRLMGVDSQRYAPIYQTGIILRCLEGCPLLQTLELSKIRLVDTAEQQHEAEQKSFSSPNSSFGNILETRARGFGATASRWLPWMKLAKPTIQSPSPLPSPVSTFSFKGKSQVIRGSELASLATHHKVLDEISLDKEISPPREDYKCKYLTTLKLRNLYVNDTIILNFVAGLFNRSPNLSHLALASVPANIEFLATTCPKLRILDIERDPKGPPFSPLNIGGYLKNLSADIASINPNIPMRVESDTFILRGLRSLRLSGCMLSNLDLHSFPVDFIRYQLQHLELTRCSNITSLGLAKFLAQCWSLETVKVDQLMAPVGVQHLLAHRTRIHGENSNSTGNSGAVVADSKAIKWECGQIRYLDVCAPNGTEESFEHIFLDMVVRLGRLEFLGMSTDHIPWLMKHEPLRYADPPRPSTDSGDGEGPKTQTGNISPTGISNDNEFKDHGDLIPLGMLGSVKTLSLNVSCVTPYYPLNYDRVIPILSVEQVSYLHDAFPALEKIVYSGNTFPCTKQARNWLLHTPRQIEVVHRSKDEVHKAVLNL